MKCALIYTFWGQIDLKNPIILSIASFRKFHPKMGVYVIDMGNNADWRDWPKILNFKILKRSWAITRSMTKKPKGVTVRPEELSRPEAILWALDQINEDLIIHADSDLIFFKHLFPLEGQLDQINIAPNIGLFYFDKSEQSRMFVELWASLCIAGATKPEIAHRIAMAAHPYPPIFHEECVSKYILEKYKSQFSFGQQSIYENCLLHYFNIHDWIDTEKIKILHLNYAQTNSLINRDERGKWFLAIKESNEIIKEILGKHISKIFLDTEEFDHCADSFKNLTYMKKMIGEA